MRTEDQIARELAQADRDLAALRDRVRGLGAPVTRKDAEAELARLTRRKEDLRKEQAELGRPHGGGGGFSLVTRDSLLKAAAEMRAIQIGSGNAGAINQVRELFKEIADNDDILSLASYYYGPNASTNIPVLSPMSEPEGYPEASDSVALDTAAGISVTELQPYAYAAVLPVSAEMIAMGAVDIEAELPSIFSKAFARKMHRGMLQGEGTSSDKLMRGIFTSAAANTGSDYRVTGGTSGKLTVTELAELALMASAKDESFRIVMNPGVYQGILSSSTSDSEDIKIYKEGLIRDKSIEGVPVLLDSLAPSEESGKAIAVAVPLSRYAIGVAGELRIEPLRTPRDTQTYYQAIMFFSGKQVSDKDVLSAVSG